MFAIDEDAWDAVCSSSATHNARRCRRSVRALSCLLCEVRLLLGAMLDCQFKLSQHQLKRCISPCYTFIKLDVERLVVTAQVKADAGRRLARNRGKSGDTAYPSKKAFVALQ